MESTNPKPGEIPVDSVTLKHARDASDQFARDGQYITSNSIKRCIERLYHLEHVTDNPAIVKTIADLERDKIQLTTDLQNDRASLEQLRVDNKQLEADFDASTNANLRLREEIQDLESQLEEMQRARDSSDFSADKENGEVKRLQTELAEWIGSTRRTREQLRKTKSEKERLESILKQTTAELDKARRSNQLAISASALVSHPDFIGAMIALGFRDNDEMNPTEIRRRVDMVVDQSRSTTEGIDKRAFLIINDFCTVLGFPAGTAVPTDLILRRLTDTVERMRALERIVGSVARALGFPPIGISREALTAAIEMLTKQYDSAQEACESIRTAIKMPIDGCNYDSLVANVNDMASENETNRKAIVEICGVFGVDPAKLEPFHMHSFIDMIRDRIVDATDSKRVADDARKSLTFEGGPEFASLLAIIDERDATIKRQRQKYRRNERLMNSHTTELMNRLSAAENVIQSANVTISDLRREYNSQCNELQTLEDHIRNLSGNLPSRN